MTAPLTGSPVTAAEYALEPNIQVPSAWSSATLQALLDSAWDALEKQCNQPLAAKSLVEVYILGGRNANVDVNGLLNIVSKNSPIISVASIKWSQNVGQLGWTPSTVYDVLIPLVIAYDIPFVKGDYGLIQFTYVSGYARPIAAPLIPAISNQGTPGSTTYSYQVTALDENGETMGSPVKTTATGHATLDGTNFNRITWTAVTGASSYRVYRTAGGSTQGLIGSPTLATFDDTGLTGDAAPTPTINSTGAIPPSLRQANIMLTSEWVGVGNLPTQGAPNATPRELPEYIKQMVGPFVRSA